MADGQSLKLIYEEGYSDNTNFEIDNNAVSSEKAVTASYAISHLIAKHSKPFTEGEFVKECLIEAVKSFVNSLTLAEATSIPLNKKTVAARVTHIAYSIEEKLKDLLATCSYFSLCLDESTDNRHVSQLSIFARIVQNDFSYVEELLNFVPLHGTTTGIDIFRAVEQTLEKFNIDFSKCSAIVTETDAKAMTGSKIGFFGQIKQQNLKFPLIHCIIHQEALCGKAIKLCTAMQIVTKIINAIKGGHKFLNHRKFQSFLKEHNAIYKDIPLHSEFDMRFNDFELLRKDLILFENPLLVPIEEQNIELQAELCDLQNDLPLKPRLEKC
ncbi:general transcription factor II-I repeat domain-containing protein 2-like [Polyergus mexicanus]|uniref:general transcription factor II-I repeat domain-containing protein 2-like n=1 Tax=Polyergus mexicanus TaxID=615972 RepID=UPI0038B5E020